MTTYRQAGVDQNMGDLCSAIAYRAAKKTFPPRKGMIGSPLPMDGGFTGALDMGPFLLVQNEDGVGTKIEVAQRMCDFSTLGADLVAMVADDAVCAGAETISITNTIDTSDLRTDIIEELMEGLARVCREQRIVIPGGEIAMLKGHVLGYTWNATAVGIVEKEKFIRGENIRPGDPVIGIASPNFRSNGFTLLRAILKKEYGEKWHEKKFRGLPWGAVALEPSVVYHASMLALLGRYKKPRAVQVNGIAHITGGGIPGNAPRMFGRQKLGLFFDRLPPVPEAMLELQRLGGVEDREAYETWNMGVGMMFAVGAADVKKALAILKREGLKADIVGEVTKKPGVVLKTGAKKEVAFE
ncbi:hypothetical protein HYV58_01490 [Candidatus Peregrinibacteria bacterium]|nr:hypothetical protein [Candidatus Peregrinibacteria bacterium]